MRLATLPVLLATLSTLAMAPTAPTAQAQQIQTAGITYSGFACPRIPVHVVSTIPIHLILTTTTNFTNQARLTVPSQHISAPIPFTATAIDTEIDVPALPPGSTDFHIDAPPMTGSYGPSCDGTFEVRAW